MAIDITIAQFRLDFPEFASETVYPDSSLSFWLTVGTALIIAPRWGTLANVGVELFIAHQLVLEAQAQRAAALGGIPGTQIGVLTSKAVDKVSAGYDAEAAIIPGAGHWNMTTYGTRFMWLVNMMGAGPVQVGGWGCSGGYGGGLVGNACGAWAGPWPWNFPNMNM